MTNKDIFKEAFCNAVREAGYRSDSARNLYVRDVSMTEATLEYKRKDETFTATFQAVSVPDAVDTIKKLDALFV